MTGSPIRDIVIVGGGTSGWMAAAVLSKVLKNNYANITLVESESIGTIGVGEATIPQILTLINMLGIDENEFIRRSNATFKLGIEFKNWSRIGASYIHPFGNYGIPLEGVEFHHFWLRDCERRQAAGLPLIDLETYNLQALAARNGKFMRPNNQPNSPLSSIAYAFHFDTNLVAPLLREIAEAQGVKRIEGRVTNAARNSETGYVEKLTFENGEMIDGQLFIDCSGFRGLLIEGALETGYTEWRKWLPVDRAVAVPTTRDGEPDSYTRATAHSAGWQWRIPLQHRMGNGHVYCSDFMDEEAATKILFDTVEGAQLASPKHLRFTTGHRKKFWNKNVVAIGLSAGFMEPLESTSIHLAQSGLARLLQLFPRNHISQVDVDYYNESTIREYEQVRDFLILHYHATTRDDSEFWNYVRTMPIPDNLQQKYDFYEQTGRVFRNGDELFNETSWLAVLEGQEIKANSYHAVADVLTDEELSARMNNIHDVIATSCAHIPNHGEFIRTNCAAAAMETAN